MPKTVLVIDDEALIRWALADTLAEAGHAVVEAPDGAGGLRAVMTVSQAFELIFLDFRLPDSSDFALLTAIRSWAPRSAVVLMTASATPEMVDEAYRLGVYRVLHKPFDILEANNILSAVAAARRAKGDDDGSTRNQRVPISVSMDRNQYGDAHRTVDLRHLLALP
ncbi:MAG TPA: response regulator [Vicinamibacterales bacterium]|nr:response regulator [Vicinamibacterales bacterium]